MLLTRTDQLVVLLVREIDVRRERVHAEADVVVRDRELLLLQEIRRQRDAAIGHDGEAAGHPTRTLTSPATTRSSVPSRRTTSAPSAARSTASASYIRAPSSMLTRRPRIAERSRHSREAASRPSSPPSTSRSSSGAIRARRASRSTAYP